MKLKVDIWSDIACPWCYVGKRRFEAALARFPHPVEVTWRAFELDPSAKETKETHATHLSRKFGIPAAQAEGMLQQMTQTAARDGLDFHFERTRGGNTFDAHRVLHLAAERGVQDAVKERFMAAYFTNGDAISDHETLTRLAAEAGLVASEVRELLASDRYAQEVRADEAEAQALGIRGVPFFAVGGYGISGAQSPDVLLQALETAWAALPEAPAFAEGAACGPDGCN